MSKERDGGTISVRSIFADELRSYLDAHREKDYLLVDVREPLEYRRGHIPGARLIPLGRVESRIHELDREQELLFYCASGNRSRVAAMLVAESGLNPPAVFTVEGGYAAWNGKQLVDFPRTKIFSGLEDVTAVLTAAMNLEKGAWRFYGVLVKRYPDSPLAAPARTLLEMEHRHARLIHRFLRAYSDGAESSSFDELFRRLPGDILEGGKGFEEALAAVESLDNSRCLGFAEMALDIEYNAYDLYRNLSLEDRKADEKDAFMTLAEQEKGHIRMIAAKLKDCFETVSGTP